MVIARLLNILIQTVLAGAFPRSLPPEAPNTDRVILPEGANRTIRVDGLRRAALGNPKVARARAVPPNEILLTAKAKGNTTLRIWSDDGTQREFAVRVVDSSFQTRGDGPGVVRVDLQFLEIDENGSEKTGIKWPELISASANALMQGGAAGSTLSYTVGSGSVRGWVQQLVTEGRARLLAKPEIYVRIGEEAVFSSGGEIPVPTTSEVFGRVQRHVEWKPYGMNVKVRPDSADAYHLQSDIHVEISELNSAGAIAGIPALHRRRLSTKVNSIDGETVLLSGLVRRLESTQGDGVPLLKDLPVFGPVFSSRSGSREAHEVMMAVTFSIATRQDGEERLGEFGERFEKASLR